LSDGVGKPGHTRASTGICARFCRGLLADGKTRICAVRGYGKIVTHKRGQRNEGTKGRFAPRTQRGGGGATPPLGELVTGKTRGGRWVRGNNRSVDASPNRSWGDIDSPKKNFRQSRAVKGKYRPDEVGEGWKGGGVGGGNHIVVGLAIGTAIAHCDVTWPGGTLRGLESFRDGRVANARQDFPGRRRRGGTRLFFLHMGFVVFFFTPQTPRPGGGGTVGKTLSAASTKLSRGALTGPMERESGRAPVDTRSGVSGGEGGSGTLG